jgi:hypothetical protein
MLATSSVGCASRSGRNTNNIIKPILIDPLNRMSILAGFIGHSETGFITLLFGDEVVQPQTMDNDQSNILTGIEGKT